MMPLTPLKCFAKRSHYLPSMGDLIYQFPVRIRNLQYQIFTID